MARHHWFQINSMWIFWNFRGMFTNQKKFECIYFPLVLLSPFYLNIDSKKIVAVKPPFFQWESCCPRRVYFIEKRLPQWYTVGHIFFYFFLLNAGPLCTQHWLALSRCGGGEGRGGDSRPESGGKHIHTKKQKQRENITSPPIWKTSFPGTCSTQETIRVPSAVQFVII